MSKSILVIDTPSCCMDGPMHFQSGEIPIGRFEYLRLFSCRYAPSDAEDFYLPDISSEKPDWCPRRELPEKIDENNTYTDQEYYRAQGWNDCIDEILGESEDCS